MGVYMSEIFRLRPELEDLFMQILFSSKEGKYRKYSSLFDTWLYSFDKKFSFHHHWRKDDPPLLHYPIFEPTLFYRSRYLLMHLKDIVEDGKSSEIYPLLYEMRNLFPKEYLTFYLLSEHPSKTYYYYPINTFLSEVNNFTLSLFISTMLTGMDNNWVAIRSITAMATAIMYHHPFKMIEIETEYMKDKYAKNKEDIDGVDEIKNRHNPGGYVIINEYGYNDRPFKPVFSDEEKELYMTIIRRYLPSAIASIAMLASIKLHNDPEALRTESGFPFRYIYSYDLDELYDIDNNLFASSLEQSFKVPVTILNKANYKFEINQKLLLKLIDVDYLKEDMEKLPKWIEQSVENVDISNIRFKETSNLFFNYYQVVYFIENFSPTMEQLMEVLQKNKEFEIYFLPVLQAYGITEREEFKENFVFNDILYGFLYAIATNNAEVISDVHISPDLVLNLQFPVGLYGEHASDNFGYSLLHAIATMDLDEEVLSDFISYYFHTRENMPVSQYNKQLGIIEPSLSKLTLKELLLRDALIPLSFKRTDIDVRNFVDDIYNKGNPDLDVNNVINEKVFY